MGRIILNKATDTSLEVGRGGRIHAYWHGKQIKSNKGNYVGGRPLGDTVSVQLEELLSKWHLRAFEFGNWESQNERWDNVVACDSALKDLKRIIDTYNLGFDNHIAVAFGARGFGGNVAAHYEASHNIINMTKPKGDGALAHEYGHAIDYNFGTFIDQNKKFAALSGGHCISTENSNVGGQLRWYINTIVEYVRGTVSYQFCNDDDYHSRSTEIFARFFEEYVAYTLNKKGIGNDYLTHRLQYYYVNAKNGYLTYSELLPILPVADRLMDALTLFYNGKGTLKKMDFPKLPARKKAVGKDDKNMKLFGSWSNVAEFPKTVENRSELAKKYDYSISKHIFTEDEKKGLGYALLSARIRKKGWAFQVDFKERGIAYVATKGGVLGIVNRMSQNTFIYFYDKKAGKPSVKNAETKGKSAKMQPVTKEKRAASTSSGATKDRTIKKSNLAGCKIKPSDLYPFCANEKTRPAMNGVHYNKGYIEATDGHILAQIKYDYPKKNENKIIDSNGNVIDAKYPTVSMVIPKEYKQWSHIKLSKLLTEQFLKNAKKLSDFCKVRRLPDTTMVVIGEKYNGNIDNLQATHYYPFVKSLRLASKINPDATVYYETSRKARPIIIDLGNAGIILCMPINFDSKMMDFGGYIYYNQNIAVPSEDYTDKIQNIAKK